MREILFRGKSTGNGEWVYGVAFPHDNCAKVTMFRQNQGDGALEGLEVLPETVGQFTGLTDKNGTRVFEGDILKEYGSAPEYSLMVIKNTWFGCFIEFYFHGEIHSREQVGHTGWLSYDEVIGNIHDNPELLEVTK